MHAPSRQLVSGSVVSFASLVLAKVALIINSVVIARRLGASDVGILTIAWNIIAVGTLFATIGVPTALVKFLAERESADPQRISELVTAGFLLTLVAGILTCVGLLILSPLLATSVYQENALIPVLWISAVGLAIGAMPSSLFAVFQGLQRTVDLARRNIITSFLSVPLTVTLVLALGLLGAALAGVGSAILGVAVSFRLFGKIWREKGLHWTLPVSRAVSRRIARFAFPTLLSSVVVPVAIWIANTFLILRYSTAEFGQFAVANSLASYLLFVPAAVGIPFLPIMSEIRSSNRATSRLATGTMRVVVLFTTPLAVFLILFSGPVVGLLYGQAFGDASVVLPIMVVGMLFAAVAAIIGYAIAAIGHPWRGLFLNLIWASTLLPISWVLVFPLGGVGLALAYLLAYAVLSISGVAYGWSLLGLRHRDFLIPSVIACAGVAVSEASTLTLNGLPLSAASTVIVASVLILNWKVMKHSERQAILAIAKKAWAWL